MLKVDACGRRVHGRPGKDPTATKFKLKSHDEIYHNIRAGKASTRLLDGIRVDSYGSMVPISNVAAVTTPDARSIAIKPWDKSMFRIIEKAIMDSDLGITPENNGEIIREIELSTKLPGARWAFVKSPSDAGAQELVRRPHGRRPTC